MKFTYIKNLVFIIIILIAFSGCGTIVGGSNYYANIIVPKHPNAEIYLNNRFIGNGSALISVKRKDADKLIFVVKKQGCNEETKYFTTKSLRWLVSVGSIYWGFFAPVSIIIDLVTGAIYKPNINENGVEKEDYKNFTYVLNYTGCNYNLETKPDQIVTATIPNKSVNEFPTSIFLLNGGNSKGKIIERMAGDSLKLKNSFGSTFIYSFNEIDFIKTDKNGQNNDSVFLKNGQSIIGVILEETPKKDLKILVEDGSILTFTFTEIESITKIN
jgi:sRNA-binding regulator protein Hfq